MAPLPGSCVCISCLQISDFGYPSIVNLPSLYIFQVFNEHKKNQKDFLSYFCKNVYPKIQKYPSSPSHIFDSSFLTLSNQLILSMSYPYLLDCQWCGGPHNGANCPGCGMVELGYDIERIKRFERVRNEESKM